MNIVVIKCFLDAAAAVPIGRPGLDLLHDSCQVLWVPTVAPRLDGVLDLMQSGQEGVVVLQRGEREREREREREEEYL